MVRELLLLLGLAVLCTQAEFILKQTDITTEWHLKTKGSHFVPLVTKVKDELVYVSFPQYATLMMKLESSMMKRACEISLGASINDSVSASRKIIKHPFGATTLKNGKIVVPLLEADSSVMHEEMVKIYIIDRHTCTFDVVHLSRGGPEVPEYRTVNVLATSSGFAVLMRDANYCAVDKICMLLFNETSELFRSYETSLSFESESWTINWIDEEDTNQGLIYTATIMNWPDFERRSVMKKLDPNFEVVYEREWPGQLMIFSMPEKERIICEPSGLGFDCTFLDAELKDGVTARVDMSCCEHNWMSFELFNLPDGGAVILSVNSYLPRGAINDTLQTFYSYAYPISELGEVGEPIRLHKAIFGYYKIGGFQVGRGGLCITASTVDRVSTKCLNPRKERLLNLLSKKSRSHSTIE